MSNLATIVNNILADSGIDDISVVIGSGTSGYIPVFTATGRTIGDSVINQSGGNVLIGGNIALHAGNFNSYAPTLGGIGASGTWGISITGNADTVDGYHMNQNLLTSSSPTFAGLTSNGSIFVNGVGVFTSSSDHQISLRSPDAWTGIEFDDSAGGFDYIWFNGLYQTFAIGGGGSSVLGKKLHIDGGTTIGVNYDSTSVPTNGLAVEGTIKGAAYFDSQANSGFRLRNSVDSANVGGFTRRGLWEGNSNYDPAIWAETGYGLYLYTNGSASPRITVDTNGNTTIHGALGVGQSPNTSYRVITAGDIYLNGNANGWAEGTWKQRRGGGTYYDVIDTGNFNSYAPTLTGGGASGTWGISISGTAGSAGSATTASYVDGTSGGAIRSWDIRTISPSSMSAYRLGFGFTSWNNNSGAPYADYLHLRSYSDGSGGADNLVTFLKSGIGMRIWQQSFGSSSPYSSYADVLLSTNYSSYALPLSGGTLSGPFVVNSGGSYPIQASSSQRYIIQARNTANTINPSSGWWWFVDTNLNMGFHADGVADRLTLTRDGDLDVARDIYLGSSNTRMSANSGTGYLSIYGSAGNYLNIGPYNNNGWGYVESIGNSNGLYLYTVSGGRFAFDNGDVTPYTDAENSLGNPSYRWAQVYTAGWFRNYGAQGIYNQSYGTHFYSNSSASWNVTGSGGNVEIAFRSNHESTIRGYVYGNTSNEFGLLSNDGNWVLRTYNRGVEAYGTMKSPYFENAYDVSTDHPFGIYFGSGRSTAYAIYRESGAWSWPYPDLRIAFHTGIKIGANASYKGIKFYNDYDMATQVMSVNNSDDGYGANNVYINNSLYVGSVVRASEHVVNSYTRYGQYGTYSGYMTSMAYLSFDWDASYNSYANHGIASTNRFGSFSDNMSINSYNDINLRIDSNDNDDSSYVRFHHHTTGENQFAYIGYNSCAGQFQMFLAGKYCTNNGGYEYNDGYWSSYYSQGAGAYSCDFCTNWSLGGCGLYVSNYGPWISLNAYQLVQSPPSGECFCYDGWSGTLYIGGNICQNYYSDCKYKENITEIDSALDKIEAMRGVEFDWNELGEEEAFKVGHEVGLIAQEVQAVYPQAVREVSKEREDHVVTALVVDYDKFTPLLIQSIKELNAKVDTIKSRIDASGL